MKPISNRYMQEEFIISLDKGLLYRGKDLSLQRVVFIYAVPHQGKPFAETYIQKIGSSAQGTNHAPYMHIFDVETDNDYIYIIMKYIEGSTLQNVMLNRTFTFEEAVAFVTGMSQTLMEIAEERPLNFSINPDNIWVSDDLQIAMINTWDKYEHNQRLSKEMSGAFYRLLTRSELIPADTESLRSGMQNSSLLHNLPVEQKEAAIRAVIHAQEERLSAISFVQSLKDLLNEPDESASRTQPVYSATVPVPTPTPTPTPKSKFLGSSLTGFKQALFSKVMWKRISITLSLALFSGAIFIGVFAFLIETTTGPKKTASTASGTGQKQQASPPAQAKPKTEEVRHVKEPAVETASADSGNQVTIPVLTGLTKEAAEQQALAAGLRYAYFLETNQQSAGTVFKQEPSPNQQAVKGSRVTFWISKGSPSP
ncbi:MAG: hypothetical protein K0S39_4209 [Paenibacillus sp.]|jgi:serine/threonine-protein kinase|nr:hypothetical protein [Paenibacillus sp.]